MGNDHDKVQKDISKIKIKEAGAIYAKNDLDNAKNKYQEVLTIDGNNTEAKAKINEINPLQRPGWLLIERITYRKNCIVNISTVNFVLKSP